MANAKVILNGSTLIDVTQKTVTAGDIVSPKTAIKNDGTEITGSITSKSAQTYTPTTTDQTISAGQYLAGAQTIKGDQNLIAENIAEGVSIFGVQGSHSGGTSEVESKDVDFYDYDGTRVYSYTAQEFAALSAMPANPSHDGLTAQGWNWTLADAKTYVADNGFLDIGQVYTTSDGKTRLYISIDSNDLKEIKLYINQSKANGVTIDWGDGTSTETINSIGKVNKLHTYSHIGDYVITLNVTTGTMELGYNGTSYSVVMKRICLRKVEIGNNVTELGNGSIAYCPLLESVTIPQSVTKYSQAFLYYCHGIKVLILPKSITNMYFNNAISYNYGLKAVCLPKEVSGDFYTGFLYNCVSLKRFAIPSNITGLQNNFCRECSSMSKVVIPSNVESIGNYFLTGTALAEIHMKKSSPPTLGTYPFYNLSDYTIYVPSASLSAYQNASNWSNKSSYMVGE